MWKPGLAFVICLLCLGCKQDDEVDPRNPYVETYSITVGSTVTVSNVSTPAYSTYEDFLIVSKDDQPRTLRFIFARKTVKGVLNKSGEFEIPSQTYTVYPISVNVGRDQLFEGKGVFTSKGVEMTLIMNEAFPGMQVKEVLKIKGHKKY